MWESQSYLTLYLCSAVTPNICTNSTSHFSIYLFVYYTPLWNTSCYWSFILQKMTGWLLSLHTYSSQHLKWIKKVPQSCPKKRTHFGFRNFDEWFWSTSNIDVCINISLEYMPMFEWPWIEKQQHSLCSWHPTWANWVMRICPQTWSLGIPLPSYLRNIKIQIEK